MPVRWYKNLLISSCSSGSRLFNNATNLPPLFILKGRSIPIESASSSIYVPSCLLPISLLSMLSSNIPALDTPSAPIFSTYISPVSSSNTIRA